MNGHGELSGNGPFGDSIKYLRRWDFLLFGFIGSRVLGLSLGSSITHVCETRVF